MCCLCLHDETVGGDELRGHHTERSEALGDDITLHVSVVVLARPHEPSVSLDGLGDHVVCRRERIDVRWTEKDSRSDMTRRSTRRQSISWLGFVLSVSSLTERFTPYLQ